jgi:hypothetical protein
MPDRVTPHFRTGWRLFQSHASAFVISMLFLFLSWVVLEFAVIFLHQLGLAVWLVLHLGWLLLFSGMLAGAHAMALVSHCLVVSCGLALLIVPGIYLAIRYCLFAQIITDTSASAFPALRKAAELACGNWAPLGALFPIAFLLNVGGLVFLGIGLVISLPVSLLAIAGFYRSLQPAAR